VGLLSDLTLRSLSSHGDCHACVALQEEVWGAGFLEKVPPSLLLLANELGGLAAGAFDGHGRLQGFVFGLPGWVDGELVHWSDMLAVRREWRGRGLGRALKLYQRQASLDRGILRMHWSFDPLQGRNAYLNFSKLGIVCREYRRDMYGETGSFLHRGVGTDRMVATWEMDSRRVVGRLEGSHRAPGWEDVLGLPRVVGVREKEGLMEPVPASLELDDPWLVVAVPTDFQELMLDSLPLAVRWREVTREAFVRYLSRGYEVREFVRGAGVSGYLLAGPAREPEGPAGDGGHD
jgi:chorismate synthase